MIGQALQQFTTAAGTSVHTLIDSRLYPLVLPAKPTLPAATYQQISRVAEQTNDGPTGFNAVRLQIDSWGLTALDAAAVAAAFEAMLDGLTGAAGGADVVNAWLESESDYLDPGTRLYCRRQDWMVQYRAG